MWACVTQGWEGVCSGRCYVREHLSFSVHVCVWICGCHVPRAGEQPGRVLPLCGPSLSETASVLVVLLKLSLFSVRPCAECGSV